MPNINDMFPSNYLKADDLSEGDLTLQIKEVKPEKMKDRDGEEESKPVLYFTEQPKGLILNKTNAKAISELYGTDYTLWVGKKITLFWTEVDSFGEMKPAIRVRKQKPITDLPTLKKQYEVLFDQAKKTKVIEMKQYELPKDVTVEQIIELGKTLRQALNDAEAFTN